MEPLKLPKTYDEQIAILKGRGLEIPDVPLAKSVLSRINYFRMMNAYSLSLYDGTTETGEPHYRKGTTFFEIDTLYSFDTKLRQILSELIEPFELAFKTSLSYYLAHKYCATCYLRKDLFKNEAHFCAFSSALARERVQQARSKIISHHKEKYNGILPIWAVTEVLSFGEVAKLYQNLNDTDKQQFSKAYYGVDKDYLASWLRCFVSVRNICAHYGRLYYRNLEFRAKLFRDEKSISNYKIFSALYLLFKLVPDPVLKLSLLLRLEHMITEYTAVKLENIGFPANWKCVLIKAGGLEDAFPPADSSN